MTDTYESSAKKIMEQKRKELTAKKAEFAPQDNKKRESNKAKSISMHKLRRLVLTGGQPWYTIPMHSFDLSHELLIHTHKNERGMLQHILCLVPVMVDKYMKEGMSETDAMTQANNACEHCAKTGWEYAPKIVTAMIHFVFNKVGEQNSFNKFEDGVEKTITYFINPSHVVEIQSDGNKGGDKVLGMFREFDKNGMFKNKIWTVTRQDGIPTKGKDNIVRKIGGGFDTPTTLTKEELIGKIGSEGFEPELPAYAAAWANKIEEMKLENFDAAKDEVFRFILTSMDNAKEVADIKGIQLPQKVFKENTSVFS